jgi:hypothetical protein
VTHGLFSVGSLTIVMENKTGSQAGNFMIDFTAWLAPFDLGIMQHVTFHVKPSFDFTEYMETGMTILRKSGEHNIWWRVNKRFVNLIRKQLLIWRSLDDDKKAFFAALMTSHINTKDHSLV